MKKITPKTTVKAKSKKLSVAVPAIEEIAYDQDFHQWVQNQSIFLQKGEFEKLDRDHLREEIESLGISLQRALESYIANLLMHKLKIKYQPQKHTGSWDNSIKTSVFQIEKLIVKNPSLKSYLPELFKDAYFTARLDASSETGIEEKVFPKECPWSIEELFPYVKAKIKKTK